MVLIFDAVVHTNGSLKLFLPNSLMLAGTRGVLILLEEADLQRA